MKPFNIVQFARGEAIALTFFAKNRDGSAITTPASQAITMTLARTAGGAAEITLTSIDTLVTVATAEFDLDIPAASITEVQEGVTWYYNLWTTLGSADPIRQRHGKFVLQQSIEV